MMPFLCLTINTSLSVSLMCMTLLLFVDILALSAEPGEYPNMEAILSMYLNDTMLKELPYVVGYCGEFREGIMQQAGPHCYDFLSLFLFSHHCSITPFHFPFELFICFTCIALLFTHDLMHSHAVHTQPHPQSCCLHIASCTVSYTATFLSI